MASLDPGAGDSGHKKGPGVKKAKKLSTNIDMTPMVDLGFLLITFFIFTTTMSSPTAMKLNMPKETDKDEELNKAKESGALTILLAKDNTVYYYAGQLEPDASNFESVGFKGIREVIINKRKDVIANHQHDDQCPDLRARAREKGDPNAEQACRDRDLVVVIKPTKNATYKNTVDILDEMTINGVKRFAIVEPFEEELQLIQKTEETSGGNGN